MSAAIVSAFHHDYRDLYKGLQSHRATTDFRQQVSALERQLTGQLVNSYASSVSALNNLSSLSTVKTPTKQHAPLTSSNSVANCNVASHVKSISSNREHRKLDRSVSEPADRSQANLRPAPPNSSRYKTELCRPFEENGTCKYGDKCQFAHGVGELRTLTRHPKYKTELCRTFHTTGFCPYGPRCHFIHNSEDSKKCLLNTLQNSTNGAGNVNIPPGNVGMSPGNPASIISPGNGSVNQGNITVTSPKLSNSLTAAKDLEICSFSLGSAGDLSPTNSSSSSGSPTSSLGGFFLDDTHMSYNLPQVPQTAPPTVSNNFFFGSDYVPALAIPPLVSQQDYYSSQPEYESEDNMLSTINMLVSEMDNINCCDGDSIKADLPTKTEPGTTLDANRNLLRLPIFSRLAHGSSP